MCGILVYFHNSENDEFIKNYEENKKYINDRGPDKIISKHIDNISITFSRLSIMDLSDHGDQPFISNGVIMLCNGEIYNYKELIKSFDLKCESNSDCEVILHLYNKIGFINTVQLLDGDFAIILIDTNTNNVYATRDRVGVRPLFLGTTSNNTNVFSSIVKPIDNYCINITQLEPYIYEYKYNKEGELSLTNIDVYTHNIFKIRQNNFIPALLHHYLEKSVTKRLMSDRKIGCLLSGGLDSSLVTSILCKKLGPENVRTYSVGMKNSVDLKYAKIVADHLGTKHTEIIFTEEEGLNIIPEVIEKLETYDITTIRASVGMYIAGKYISKNTDDKVIFSGEGSDELLCGYLYFHHTPTPNDAYKESHRLYNNLYKYDVLRADRTISSNGLELRVPFLDREFIDLCLSISGEHKIPQNKIEKYFLRKAFENNYLPTEVLWRRKEGMSDGISSLTKSWYQIIQEHIDKVVDNDNKYYLESKEKFYTKEAFYYKMIYDSIFSNYKTPITEFWMPKWIKTNGDPSGRLVSV